MYMNELLNTCILCPRKCGVNRNNGEVGFCHAGNKIRIAKAYLHKWEEPPITGKNGSGTIFFSNCNLKCVYCQNYYIGEEGNGVDISVERFSEICLKLQNEGATNINLVTPTHYVPLIIDGLKIAKKNGLNIPIVYNSSGYEEVNTIKLLDGVVDIYLPDFKYYSDEYAKKYSKCNDYFEFTTKALDEMIRQKPRCKFDKDGNMTSGVIIRHLMIPGLEEDSKKILNYLYKKYENNVFYSIMNQYTPVRKLQFEELNRVVGQEKYDEIIDYAWDLGIRNAFIQDGGTQSDSFIPKWDFKG